MDHSINNEVLTIFLKGRINSGNADEIEQGIEALLNSVSFKSIVFDVNELEYVSSAGLRILLRVKQQYDDTKLINVSEPIYEIFDMVGFTNFLTIEKK